MDYYNSLVAGSDNPGFRDGAFSKAQFDHPCGLAIDDSGNRLFIADRNNHRIRVVYLNEENRVETLAGSDTSGSTDGPLLKASFKQPIVLAYLPDNRLAVYDTGDHLLRLIDIKNKAVLTLAGKLPDTSLGNIWGLCYRPQDDSLYFSEPGERRLRKWDMKAGKLVTILSDSAQVPMPRAICVSGKNLYVADVTLPEIYQVDASGNTSMPSVTLTKVGTCSSVNSLAGSKGIVYAAQEGTNSLVRILPDNQPVSLETAWGFFVDNNDKGVDPLFEFHWDVTMPSGFVASPKDAHKLFITCPFTFQSVIGVKDYDFGVKENYTDFNYPDEKPEGTFRILIVGDSRVAAAMLPLPEDKRNDPTFDVAQWDGKCSFMKTHTFPKQLEFFLNAEGCLNGAKNHFEVLTLWQPSTPSGLLVNNSALDTVKKKDIDLVIALVGWSTYPDYFDQPLTAEGLPGGTDPEWILKPASSRIPAGVPRHLFDLCVREKLAALVNDKLYWNIDLSNWNNFDTDIRKDLMELNGRPFRLCQNKLQTMKTANGDIKKLLCVYIPWRTLPSDSYEDLWRETCSAEHLNLLDLSEPFLAMKTSFYPTSQKNLSHHYMYYGDNLIAFLLSHYLTEQKWVSFETRK